MCICSGLSVFFLLFFNYYTLCGSGTVVLIVSVNAHTFALKSVVGK